MTRRLGTLCAAALFTVVVASIVRVVLFCAAPPLWTDETRFALGLFRLRVGELSAALDHGQAGPPLFLAAIRVIMAVLGISEHTLRLLPILAGIALIPMIYAAARVSSPRAALVLLQPSLQVSRLSFWHTRTS